MDRNNKESMYEKIMEYRNLELGGKFLCMFSGGKDSGLALALALKRGKPTALIHILEGTGSLYHEQKTGVIEAQSQAMNIPLCYMSYKWWHNWSRACEELRGFRESGTHSIVFGDIRLEYIFRGDIPLCEKARFKACLPIGGESYDNLMNQIEENNIVSVITKINHPAISRSLLGEIFSREIYHYMNHLGIDPFGELDEFHTTLVNADFFKAPLRYHLVPNGADRVSVMIDS